jgi:hypothetical protein
MAAMALCAVAMANDTNAAVSRNWLTGASAQISIDDDLSSGSRPHIMNDV